MDARQLHAAPAPAQDDDRLALYDYPLEGVRIASEPSARRDGSRLLVHERSTGATHHAHFRDLTRFLRPGDLLVLNDTRVLPARLRARRRSGGIVEVLLHPTGAIGGDRAMGASGVTGLAEAAAATDEMLALLRPSARVKAGETLLFSKAGGEEGELTVLDPPGAELRRVRVSGGLDAGLAVGELPLPPYLERHGEEPFDRERYQTVFATRPGAIAAPTAGLHFTRELLDEVVRCGIETTCITLHVGPGTFLPVRTERLSDHPMHEELYEITPEAAAAVARARQRGSRVVAVGTTSTRALEAAATANAGTVSAGRARTRLLIRPPFAFRAIDALVTNFHLPRTTLLALVAAFAGREKILALYAEAVARGYRFYSYGDAMLLL